MKTENNNKSHEELKKMAELYHLLVENSPDAIGVILDRKIAFLNKPGLKLFGYTKEEIIGKDISELVHPKDIDSVLNHIETVLSEGCAQPLEYRLLTKNGEIIHVETARCKIEYEGKSAVQCIVRDIAERKKLYEEIKEMEERYRNLVESSPDGIGVTCNGKTVFVNQRWTEILGYTADELIGRNPFEFIHPEDRERAIANVKAILAGESLPSTREYKVIKKNGEIIMMEAASRRIIYEGKPAIQSIFRDVSERKKRDSDMREYIRELEILNNVAIDRELRMIELKKEANELLNELGRDRKYKVAE
jgi:PAS domain S-box-containing protein